MDRDHVVRALLDEKMRYALERGRMPNTMRLPTVVAAQVSEWIDTIENDKYLGYNPTTMRIHLFGMDFVEDATLTEPTADYVEKI